MIEEFPLCETVSELRWIEHEMTIYFQVSARKYRLEMEAILGEE